MTSERVELEGLIAELPDDQVASVLADVKRRVRKPTGDAKRFAWIGSIVDGPTDASSPERLDEVLAQGFGRN